MRNKNANVSELKKLVAELKKKPSFKLVEKVAEAIYQDIISKPEIEEFIFEAYMRGVYNLERGDDCAVSSDGEYLDTGWDDVNDACKYAIEKCYVTGSDNEYDDNKMPEFRDSAPIITGKLYVLDVTDPEHGFDTSVETCLLELMEDVMRRVIERREKLERSAPKMLKALKNIAEGCEARLRKGWDNGDSETLRICRSAIAKAIHNPKARK